MSVGLLIVDIPVNSASCSNESIPTPGGKQEWKVSTVKSILTNEKYTGNAILQKRYTVDFLTKTTKVNEGEVPQYFVKDSHPAIVDMATFDLVQAELKRRGALGKQFSGNGLFFCKISCGECGGFYGSKIWHAKDKYRRLVWQCNRKYTEKLHCATPHLSEEQIRRMFIAAFNQILADKKHVLAQCTAMAQKFSDTATLDKNLQIHQSNCDETMEAIQSCVEENSFAAQNQEEYVRRYDMLTARYKTAKEQADALAAEKQDRLAEAEKIRRFIDLLEKTEQPLAEFNPRLWCTIVEAVTVYPNRKVVFQFAGDTKIHIEIEK